MMQWIYEVLKWRKVDSHRMCALHILNKITGKTAKKTWFIHALYTETVLLLSDVAGTLHVIRILV
jgi:hypothetical protein